MDRSMTSDLWRACLAVLIGIVSGLVVAALLNAPHILIELAALVAGPTFFVVLFLNFKRTPRSLALARTLGFMMGWLTFVLLYSSEAVTRPIYALQSTGLVLMLFSAIALPLVTGGITVASYLWSKWSST